MGVKVEARIKKSNKDSRGGNFVPSASFNPFVLDVSSMEDKQMAMEKRERGKGRKKKIFNKRENSRVMSWVMSLISNGDVAGSRKKFAPVKIRDRRTSIGIGRARRKREIEMVSCRMFAALILLLSAVSVSCFRLGVDYGLSLFFWDTKRGEERLILPANDARILNFSSS